MSEATETTGTEVVSVDETQNGVGRTPQPPAPTTSRFDLAAVGDPTAGLQKAEELVQYMSSKCSGEEYIAQIQGKDFPRCEWWTSVGAGLGLFPQEESVKRLDREGEIAYEAVVGVYDGEQRVTRGSAICSDAEPTWSGRDEYAIRSMAITRATSKAYRNGLSFLAVMANLEPTPAEEMQGGQNGGGNGSRQQQSDEADLTCPDCGGPVWDNTDDAKSAANGGKRPNFKCKDRDECDWASWDSHEEVYGSDEEVPNWRQPETAKARNQFQVELLNWTNEDRAARIFRAFAKMSDDYPSDVKEWLPADYKRAIEAWSETGKELLIKTEEWIESNMQGELAGSTDSSSP